MADITLRDALVDVEREISDKEQTVKDRERQLEADRRDLDLLKTEYRGLRLALSRHEATAPVPTEDWPDYHRTDAVLRVMRMFGTPMSPTEITANLNELGRQDAYNDVAAALAYLHRNGRVHSIGRAQWVEGPNPNEPDEPAPDPLDFTQPPPSYQGNDDEEPF